MTEYSPKQIEMISKACNIAGVNYPDFDVTKEWVLGLAEVAQDMAEEGREEWARDYDADYAAADSEVPYMTYRLWLIWTDLQLYQNWTEMQFGNEDIDKENIERMPQIACYEIALSVIQEWK